MRNFLVMHRSERISLQKDFKRVTGLIASQGIEYQEMAEHPEIEPLVREAMKAKSKASTYMHFMYYRRAKPTSTPSRRLIDKLKSVFAEPLANALGRDLPDDPKVGRYKATVESEATVVEDIKEKYQLLEQAYRLQQRVLDNCEEKLKKYEDNK